MRTRTWIYRGAVGFACGLLVFSLMSHLQASAAGSGSPLAIVVSSLDGRNTTGCDQTCVALGGPASSPVQPGDTTRTSVLVRYTGSQTTPLAMTVADYAARDKASAPTCQATDPAAQLLFAIQEDGKALYKGTLSNFVSRFGSTDHLRLVSRSVGGWAANETHRLTFTYGVDRGATQGYLGCSTRAVFVWTARA